MGVMKALAYKRSKSGKPAFSIYNGKGEIYKEYISTMKEADAEIKALNGLWEMGLIDDGPYRVYRY